MKSALKILATGIAVGLGALGALAAEIVAPRRQELDIERLVHAICDIEGGQWGNLGGRGNMRRATWEDRTSLPYAQSKFEAPAMVVYFKHVKWLAAGLEADGLKATPARIYECWFLGLTAGIARIRYGTLSQQAQNCQNLYEAK